MMRDILKNIISAVILILAGLSNNIMDTVDHHYSSSYFKDKNAQFWDKDISWKNKYKNWPEDQRPAYPGATTFLAWTTDAWHLFKTIFLSLFTLAIILYQRQRRWWLYLIDFIVLKIAFSAGWHLGELLFN